MGHKPELRETAKQWRRLLYSRINNLFTYENLPEEINETAMKLFLNRNGKIVFYKIGDKYLIQPFTYTDKLNWYYIPKFGRVVNPWLPQGHQNYSFEIEKSAIIYNCTPDIYNFREWGVVADLIYKTAYQLAENDISYYCIQRNHRLLAIFTAETDLQKAECNRVLERMYNGEPDITMGEDLVSHIKVNPIAMNSTRSSITELIEFHQFILANFYHSFGINSNYNLKREQLNSNEIDVNQEVLRLNIEDMLQSRLNGVEKINELYGLDIRVSLNEEVYRTLLSIGQNIDNNNAGEGLSEKGATYTEMGKNEETKNESNPQTGTGENQDNEGNNIISSKQSDNNEISSVQDSKKDTEMDKQSGEDDNNEKVSAGTSDTEVQVTVTVSVDGEEVQNVDESEVEDNAEKSDTK